MVATAALVLVGVTPQALAQGVGSQGGHHLRAVKPAVSSRAIRSLRAEAALSAARTHRPVISELRRVPASLRSSGGSGSALAPATTGTATANLPIAGSAASVLDLPGLGVGDNPVPLEPADPWVAVSGSYVVQVVNETAQISSRSGAPLLTVPTGAIFALPNGYLAADARIIWDATHGRWVAVALVFPDDGLYQDNYIVTAISDTSDPTAGWRVIALGYGTELPDYPGIASSGDKLTTTADIFNPLSGDLIGGVDVETFTWSSILTGGALTLGSCRVTDLFHGRPGLVLSAGNDIHVIAQDITGTATSWDQVYFRITGAGTCSTFVNFADLADVGFEKFGRSNIVEPTQTGPDQIDQAVDERPTDAVWQSGKLYWVATQPVSYDAGATFNDEVVVYSIGTPTSTLAAPTAGDVFRIEPGAGVDAFMGGIGLTRSGIPVVTYSQSSPSTTVSWWANRLFAGGTLGSPLLLGTSDAAYGGERWGDFAGVAMDPVGTGSVWATHMLADASGGWRTRVDHLLVDTDNPSTPGVPAMTAVVPQTLGSPRYRISWGASTDAASGAVSYRLETNLNGGGFGPASIVSTTSTTRTLPVGGTVQFRVRAVDALGHASGYATSPTFTISLSQSPTSKSGTWHTASSINFSGGGTWYASGAGATASYTSSGIRSIGFVTTKASTRGSFRVYIDGSLKATISAYSTTTAYRQLVYQFTWATPGTHTIKIYVLGTAGHPRVDVDAFLVLK